MCDMQSHNPFTAHPHSVGETYFQHMRKASGFGIRMLGGACAAFAHALLPFLFVHTGSRVVHDLNRTMSARAALARSSPTSGSSEPRTHPARET